MPLIIPKAQTDHTPQPEAPRISQATRDILNRGSQIMLPFEAGDAEIRFSRWALAEMIEDLIEEARQSGAH